MSESFRHRGHRAPMEVLEQRRLLTGSAVQIPDLPAGSAVGLNVDVSGEGPRADVGDSFVWYDGTRPWFDRAQFDLAAFAMPTVDVPIDEVYAADTGDNPDEFATRIMAREAHGTTGIISLDLERWKLDRRRIGDANVNRNIQRFLQVINWIRDEAPTLKIGIYGAFPIRDPAHTNYFTALERAPTDPYWAARLPALEAEFNAWKAANDKLAPLVAAVDFIHPSLYMMRANTASWPVFAQYMMDEARRISQGKPVIPYIWSRFHNSVPDVGLQPLPIETWQTMLDFVRQEADSVIVWQSIFDTWTADEPWVIALGEAVAATPPPTNPPPTDPPPAPDPDPDPPTDPNPPPVPPKPPELPPKGSLIAGGDDAPIKPFSDEPINFATVSRDVLRSSAPKR